MTLSRRDAVLAALSLARGAGFTPVQVQKLCFLLDREAASALGGPHFNFTPYHYGPFDHAVYEQLEELSAEELVSIDDTGHRLRRYALTPQGQAAGEAVASTLPPPVREYLGKLVEFVRGASFAQLVSAIYRRYPEMRVNSVFQD